MLSEQEVLSKHSQCLGEGHKACQRLGRNADPTHLAPRGHDYGELRRALKELEGTCRQMAALREDTRWTKLGIFYAKVMRAIQPKFVGQRWVWFGKLAELFEQGQRRVAELKDAKTGKLGPILPQNPSSWILGFDPPKSRLLN